MHVCSIACAFNTWGAEKALNTWGAEQALNTWGAEQALPFLQSSVKLQSSSITQVTNLAAAGGAPRPPKIVISLLILF